MSIKFLIFYSFISEIAQQAAVEPSVSHTSHVENSTNAVNDSIYTFVVPRDENVVYEILVPSLIDGQIGQNENHEGSSMQPPAVESLLSGSYMRIGEFDNVNEENTDVEPMIEGKKNIFFW